MPGLFDSNGRSNKYRAPSQPNSEFHWYASDGSTPIKHDPRKILRTEELENLVVQHDFDCRLFDCANEEDMAAFREILDRVSNGWYVITKRMDSWPPAKSHPVFWVEWIVRYRTVA